MAVSATKLPPATGSPAAMSTAGGVSLDRVITGRSPACARGDVRHRRGMAGVHGTGQAGSAGRRWRAPPGSSASPPEMALKRASWGADPPVCGREVAHRLVMLQAGRGNWGAEVVGREAQTVHPAGGRPGAHVNWPTSPIPLKHGELGLAMDGRGSGPDVQARAGQRVRRTRRQAMGWSRAGLAEPGSLGDVGKNAEPVGDRPQGLDGMLQAGRRRWP